ncbi:MAG: aspartate--tRNA(Asn) ligase [Candidatus Dormibacteraeota bacterium]|nr:aspartate--tRNA(Asn) ligase [Candidatus Dormibacteraeota bacterium]
MENEASNGEAKCGGTTAAHRPHPGRSPPKGVLRVERTWTTDLSHHVGEPVLLEGWLHHRRRLANRTFLLVRDARGIAQAVVEDRDLAAFLAGLRHESVLAVEGTATATAQAPGGVEITSPRVTVLAEAEAAPPIDLFHPVLSAQLPTLLDHAALTLRHPRRRASFQVAAASAAGFRQALRTRDFVEVHTPKIVGSATEGGASVFQVDYLGRAAFLAQSPQLYKQALVGVFERVFEVGPAFRAEPHDTPMHLNEFISLDVEMGFVRDHFTVMGLLREVLAGMVAAVGEEAAPALQLLSAEMPEVPSEIPWLHFAEAVELVERHTGEELGRADDLARAHEAWLGEWARREHGSDFLFVTGYPMAKRPFYTHPDPRRPRFSNSFDLLFRGLELLTGGQRLHRHADYLAALGARGIDPAPFAGYLDAFKYGMPPHGGFAIGLERWVARLVGAANIRETALFPRDLTRLSP